MSGGSSASRRSGRLSLLRQQLIDQRTVGFPQRVAPLPERCRQTRSARSMDIVDPALHVLRPDRLRREVGQVAVAGEREMHLGDAPSGLRHVAQIGDLLLAFAGMLARRQQTLLLDEAVEIGRRHGPGVALVLRRRRGRRRSRCVLSPSTSSTLPSSAGVLAKPATSVRKRPISISGLMPGSSLR